MIFFYMCLKQDPDLNRWLGSHLNHKRVGSGSYAPALLKNQLIIYVSIYTKVKLITN